MTTFVGSRESFTAFVFFEVRRTDARRVEILPVLVDDVAVRERPAGDINKCGKLHYGGLCEF